jgi:LeuA allosteric (dimerisation) domain
MAKTKVTGLRIYAFDDYAMVGKARITVSFEGQKYVGRGSSPDVVEAAAHAYLHAAATRLTDRVPRTSAE